MELNWLEGLVVEVDAELIKPYKHSWRHVTALVNILPSSRSRGFPLEFVGSAASEEDKRQAEYFSCS